MQEKTLIIAGYSDGFGPALKSWFELAGYRVLGVSRHGAGGLQADLGNPHEVAALFDKLDRDMPPLAGVIHNAMQFHRQEFMSTSPETFEDVWRSMVLTAVNVSQQAIPRMKANGGGTLLFTGASGSRRAGAGFSAFSSAKFGLRGLAQSLAREHSADGIHVVHTVIDGLIWTERTRERFIHAQEHSSMNVDELAKAYVNLFDQHPSIWTQEQDFRPRTAAQ